MTYDPCKSGLVAVQVSHERLVQVQELKQQLQNLEAAQNLAASKLAAQDGELKATVEARQQVEASWDASEQQYKAEIYEQRHLIEELLAQARSSQVCRALPSAVVLLCPSQCC